ncbi:MAG: hypothetical protein V2I82_02545, partial [Halieaceae bacterium]|nr:hypothetical protein [Halieaceae bacterium]
MFTPALTGVGETGSPPSHSALSRIDLPGHSWMVRFQSTPAFDRSLESNQPTIIAVGGVVVDVLLFLVIWSLAGERKRVQRKADQITEALREGHTRLQLAQEAAQSGIWDLDLRTQRLVWDARMLEIYGLQA